MSPLEGPIVQMHVDVRALQRMHRSLDGVTTAIRAWGAAAERAHVPMRLTGDAAWILRDTPRSRVARRAERRRVTRQLKQDAYWRRARREQRRRHLRAHQYVEHHPGSTPLPAQFARELRASTAAMRSRRP